MWRRRVSDPVDGYYLDDKFSLESLGLLVVESGYPFSGEPLPQPLLTIQGLTVAFPTAQGDLSAVDKIDLEIGKAETVGLVGESGSGKTITGRAALNLIPSPGQIRTGKVIFKGRNLLALSSEDLRKIRGKEITAVQQDPLSALNPAFKVESQMIDILMLHRNITKSQAITESVNILRELGINNPSQVLQKYPHQIQRRHGPKNHDWDRFFMRSISRDRGRTDDRAGCYYAGWSHPS